MHRVALTLLVVLPFLLSVPATAGGSRCFGTTSRGRLEGGISLPLSGDNFSPYSAVGWSLGRTYVHADVHAILITAYRALESAAPGKVFVYGETGWQQGGPFRPHKTHQNGLSVDLMVPVLLVGKSVPLPGSIFNRFGYDIEFNSKGEYEDYVIDFEALAELIYQIHIAAKSQAVGIARIIFEVPLQQHLWSTRRGAYLKRHLKFSTRPAWVRHDEHVHIDFEVACARME